MPIEAEGLSFIFGARIPEIPDAHIFIRPWSAGAGNKRRGQVVYYQYPADRARPTLRGIDEQAAKEEKAIAGKTAVQRNRFVKLTGGIRTVSCGRAAVGGTRCGHERLPGWRAAPRSCTYLPCPCAPALDPRHRSPRPRPPRRP